jgi:uncharacterized membrane protein
LAALPLSLWDLSLFTAIMAIILIITSELLSPYYARTGIVVDRKRLRRAALIVALIFLIIVAYRVYELITTT